MPHRSASHATPRRLSPFEDDDSDETDERYDAFPLPPRGAMSSWSSNSSGSLVPSPASVPRPQRLQFVGTFLPQDSMRGSKTAGSSNNNGGSVPTSSSSAKQINHIRNAKLLARAGLDLFRQGFTFDGVQPNQHREPRHPAVSPSLTSIPEGERASSPASSSSSMLTMAFGAKLPQQALESRAIVVLGSGPLNHTGEVNASVAHRIDKAMQLYWDATRVFARAQANSFCYLVPMAEESGDDGVLECEAIRNALVRGGISPHHIIMDCSAASIIDNTVLLVPVLRHLHIDSVHIVTSAVHLPRVQKCVDGILRVVPDIAFRTSYHTAPDGFLSAAEREQHVEHEQLLVQLIEDALSNAVNRVTKQRRSSITRYPYRSGRVPSYR
uniref:DUF218 domain-containing protein n=1 Tax=Globisporangium ultimum (strain ATCC 200006 / CBS 805.95 / DAOM BR144) TaxID=431595 RepID=K3X8B8_GLOUD